MKTKFVPNHLVLMAVLALLAASLSAPAQNQTAAEPGFADASGHSFTKSWHINLPRPIMMAAWERLRKLDIPGVAPDQRFNLNGQAPDIGLYETTIGFSQTYTTRFEGAENPLSEDGRWTNNGVDWTKIRKKDGLAFGTQTGTNTGIYKFNDSYAHLSGFPPDQEASGQAYIAKPDSSCNQELEILLRWTSSAHHTTGYECFARCLNSASSYVQIVRWDGPLGRFTYLADQRGTNFGLNHGDILKASIVGNVITVYINGVEKARVTDNTFKIGNPGIGEFLAGDSGHGVGSNSDFGFSSFTARGLGGTNGSPNRGK